MPRERGLEQRARHIKELNQLDFNKHPEKKPAWSRCPVKERKQFLAVGTFPLRGKMFARGTEQWLCLRNISGMTNFTKTRQLWWERGILSPWGNEKYLRLLVPCPYQKDVRMMVVATCQHM